MPHGKHYRFIPGQNGGPSSVVVVGDDDLQGREIPNPSVAQNLAHAPSPEVREHLLELNVGMSPPGDPDTAEWLEIATQEKRSDLLKARIASIQTIQRQFWR